MSLLHLKNSKRRWLMVGLLTLGVVFVIIGVRREPQRSGAPRDSDTALRDDAGVGHLQVPRGANQAVTDTDAATSAPPGSEPMTDAAAAAENYPERIAAQRERLARLRRTGADSDLQAEFMSLVRDVENQEGSQMAQRAAYGEAATWKAQRDFRAARIAYRLIRQHFPKGPFAADSLFHIGDCHLELHQYGDAEAAFQRFVEEHSDSTLSGWGWRKLALSQLLQGEIDRSLATLDLMAAHFHEGEFADYARARRGYILMVAGKESEAQAAFDAFLAACPKSKYCLLVEKQRADLEDRVRSAGM